MVRGWGHKTCAPGTILDLDGRELGGELPGGRLIIEVPGLVLRNGTLALPDGAQVVVAAKDVRLEELTFTGTGPKGSPGDWPYSVTGLVVVEGASRSVVLDR